MTSTKAPADDTTVHPSLTSRLKHPLSGLREKIKQDHPKLYDLKVELIQKKHQLGKFGNLIVRQRAPWRDPRGKMHRTEGLCRIPTIVMMKSMSVKPTRSVNVSARAIDFNRTLPSGPGTRSSGTSMGEITAG